MDGEALGIGVFCGVVLGALLAGLLLRARLRVAEEEAEETRRDLEGARDTIAELRAASTTAMESVARTLGKATGDAQGAVAEYAERNLQMSGTLAALMARIGGGEGSGAETDAAVLEAAENATEELAGRERRLADALDGLGKRIELIDGVLDAVVAEDRMTEHKTDDLIAAAAESVGTASTMDEVIRKLQESASETADLSTQVSSEAERGYRAVHRTLDEIERIRSLSNTARSRIVALGDRVSDIGNIVKVIQEITEKTNLLALNASIIAAQAGQHGRSFQVVASEIKALAHRTATSTKEIAEQIRGVQEESDRATSAMVDGVAAVDEGFQVAISAGDALDAIRQSARGAQRKMQHMNRTLKQQSKVAARVVDAAAQVSDRAQSFASALRGQSSASDRLRGAAVDLGAAAREISELMGEQGASTTLCVETIHGVAERMALLRRREMDLRRTLAEVESTAQGGKRFGDEMAARWAAIQEATTRLRDSYASLRRS